MPDSAKTVYIAYTTADPCKMYNMGKSNGIAEAKTAKASGVSTDAQTLWLLNCPNVLN